MSQPANPESPSLSPESLGAAPEVAEAGDFFSGIEKHFEVEPSAPEATPEAKPEPEAPETVKEEAPSKVTSPKAKDFELIKQQREEARQEAQKHLSKLTELETQVKSFEAEKARLADLQKQVEKYEKEISSVRLESSPEYEKVIVEPSNRIRTEAMRLAAKYKLENTKLVDALSEADPSRQSDMTSELAATMNERDKMVFYTLVDDFNSVLSKREELTSNADAAWKEVESNRAREAEQAKKAAYDSWKSSGDKIWKAIEAKVPLGDVAKLETFKAEVASKPLSELPIDQQTYSVSAGFLLPHFVTAKANLEKKVAELEATLTKYTKAAPGAGGGSAPATSSPGSSASEGGFLDSIERNFSSGR